MATFEYVARDALGAVVRGAVEAADDVHARARLRQEGLFLTSLRARGGWGQQSASRAEVLTITQHLAVLVGAGMPLFQSLQTVADEAEEGPLRTIARGLARDVQEGRRLSAALGRYPRLFSPLYVGVVRNGEASGRLDMALERLTAYLERELELRRKVQDALVYPALVLTLAVVVMLVFLTFIIPAFDRVYAGAGASLPPPTRLLVAVSRLFRANLPVVGLVAVILFLPPMRRRVLSALAGLLSVALFRLPQAAVLVQTILLSRFTHALGALLKGGLPLVSALEVAGEATGSVAFGPLTDSLKIGVSEGRRLADAMRQTGQFPPMILRMVALGEEAGRLEAMLERAAGVLDGEVDRRLRRLLTFLEPALTLLVGGIVAMVLLALYLPIFGLSRVIAR